MWGLYNRGLAANIRKKYELHYDSLKPLEDMHQIDLKQGFKEIKTC